MALADLLYRCPECGHDPMAGEGDVARCPTCERVYERGSGDLLLRERTPDGKAHEVPVSTLVARIERRGGPLPRATAPDGSVLYAAPVQISWRVSEEPVRYKGQLRGFSELMSDSVPGLLTVDDREARISGDGVDPESWPYLDIRALQTSSSSLQLSLPGNRLVKFEFVDDSPRRWEDLLRHLVREAYRRAGRGVVVEFQPRIVTE